MMSFIQNITLNNPQKTEKLSISLKKEKGSEQRNLNLIYLKIRKKDQNLQCF